ARPAIARRLENKVYFARAAPDAWLPVPGMVAGEAGPALLEAATALRAPYVFQLARGFSGQHTHRAATSADLEALLTAYRGRLCRIAEFVVGDPVTVTGIVGEREVVLGTPCRQVTGIAACTPYPLGSCGNDFGQPAPAANAVRSVAARVAAWLQREGHRGIYGADMVVAPDGEVWCLEVNPRLVASVPLWNLAARDHGEPSMLRWHGAVFADPTVALPARLECDWSQLILHNLRAAPQQPARLQTGVGRIGDDGCFHRTGPLRLRGPAPGEAALIVRQRASRGHEVARVIFQGPCLQADGQLLPRMAALVADLRDGLGER
ncbi:MAG TPA: ATP-grasp domain-containing protein, partial [Candidatus Dormibacteraeota bacterium]|nr:ATP-grasp domain-containing protein [Candidatus Dormibacteraeota bacterium]